MPTFDSVTIFGSTPIPVKNLALENRTSTPSSPIEGQTWIRTDLNQSFIWLNGAAVRFDAGSSLVSGAAAGGDLAGTYPNPTIGANKVTLAALALALIESGVSSGTAATTDAALRKLGTGANDAMAGNRSLDTVTAPAADVSLNTHKITSLLAGTASTDAVNKAQLDAAVQGLDAKASVRVSTPLGAPFDPLTAAPSVLDGITLAANDRVMVNDGTANGGIWVVVSPGTGANGIWARAADMDAWTEFPGAFVFVEQGTTYADTGWVCTNNAGGTLGTTVVTWTQFSSAGAYVDGAGLALSGLTFSVNVDGSSIEINADTLRVKALGIVNSMIAANTIDLTTKVTGVLPAANGGRSAVVASPALTAGTYADVVHSLGVKAGRVVFKVASTGEAVHLDWRDKSGSETTTIQIKTDIAAGRASSFYDVYVGI